MGSQTQHPAESKIKNTPGFANDTTHFQKILVNTDSSWGQIYVIEETYVENWRFMSYEKAERI